MLDTRVQGAGYEAYGRVGSSWERVDHGEISENLSSDTVRRSCTPTPSSDTATT